MSSPVKEQALGGVDAGMFTLMSERTGCTTILWTLAGRSMSLWGMEVNAPAHVGVITPKASPPVR